MVRRNRLAREHRSVAHGSPARSTSAARLVLAIAPAAMLSTSPALAYIGPGTGLSALGALVALLATIVVAIAGFVWFPLRRLLRVRANARQRGRLPGRRPSP